MSRPGLTSERLIALFLLGALLFTPPFLGIFNQPDRILGIPVLYLYLFGAWLLLIVILAVVVERAGPADGTVREGEAIRPEPPSSSHAG